MFKIKANLVVVCLVIVSTNLCVRAQDSSSTNYDQLASETLAASIPKEALEKLANLTQDEGSSSMWILLPSNLSDSQLHESNFALFKLNTGQLFDLGGGGQHQAGWPLQGGFVGDGSQSSRLSSALQMTPMARGARKLGLFSNVLNKPKVSPLYLVNGTVCRFVNSQPICTTLSTTGLFRNPTQGFLTPQNNQNSGFFSNFNQNQQQQQQQQPQQQFPNSRQVTPPQQQQQQQQQLFQQGQPGFQQNIMPNQQQFRQSALMDDETKAVNVSNSSSIAMGQQSVDKQKPNLVQMASRPSPSTYTIVNRRPLNLLSLTRPFRSG